MADSRSISERQGSRTVERAIGRAAERWRAARAAYEDALVRGRGAGMSWKQLRDAAGETSHMTVRGIVERRRKQKNRVATPD